MTVPSVGAGGAKAMPNHLTFEHLFGLFERTFAAGDVQQMREVEQLAWRRPGERLFMLANDARFYASVFLRRGAHP